MALSTGNFLADSGAPDPEVGVDGDHYRNIDNQDVYFKASSIWTLIGNLGNGADGVGSTILDDDGEPLAELGVDGNYYIDRLSLNLWKKVSGIWDLIGGLVGAPVPGTEFARGTVVPDNGFGEDGYYYLRTDTGDIYHKEAGVWTLDGSWLSTPTPPSSIFLDGPGAPSGGLGEDLNHYRDSDTQDVYQKQGGVWVQIGNWSGGAGAGPFTVSDWDMSGTLSTVSQGTTVLNATNGGADPSYTLTEDGSLTGAGPIYWAGTESTDGIAISGSSTMWGDFIKPIYTAGDNLFGTAVAIVNSGATPQDVADLAGGGVPANPVWGVLFINSHTGGSSGSVSSATYANSVGIDDTVSAISAVEGDNIGVGIDFATLTAKIQRGSDAAVSGAALDLTGFPSGETLKVIHLLGFSSSTPVFAESPLVYTPASQVFSRTGFGSVGSAVAPLGAVDGDTFKVSVSGSFGGVVTQVGDFVQLYDNESKIIVTRLPTAVEAALEVEIAAREAADTAMDGRMDTAETTLTNHEGRLDALEGAAAPTVKMFAELEVTSITVPGGHTSTPYSLTAPAGRGGLVRLTVDEAAALLQLSVGSGVRSHFYIQLVNGGSLSASDFIILNYGGDGLVLQAGNFGKAVYEVFFEPNLGEWVITVIPLQPHANVIPSSAGSPTPVANREDSSPFVVLDITGAGATSYSLNIPIPSNQQGNEVLVEIQGGGGDSLTALTLTAGTTGLSQAIGAAAPGDVFQAKIRHNGTARVLDVVKMNLL